ncbi:XRE family transcriptional regulator [Burkholderia ubonensis]|uniref:helix-turn-helix transcriptional regulator n=1 Tax=Burkholderia ubonensis TaxID=101571 RepID=UPI00075A43CD|nr:helix-turn-helix transcriptional regulator [Burkholderia ubonensis]KVO53164.1 XRE family transcriptional regulator [Burkholderia ubonensis]KVX28028.1 XRE family transcriptional regulator [Burkholderia ubonensis]KWO59882.1 XRE family transcriptional regulator [Burkholderia ubonensis]OJA38185.1 XRE family transcriptional regulator [Burkholderia ubonensis]OJA86161.1 XRE family transcriptional regulator [Burkholderia ubonensis]
MIELATVEKRVLADPAARAGLTQEQVAERMRTPHSTIAYMEGGRTMPSLRTPFRYAKATGSRAVVRLDAPK